jgi:hypothetical protein
MKSKLTIDKNGTKEWKLPSGDFHKEDGPALEYKDGAKFWYLNDIPYTEQEYKYKTRSSKLKLLLH